MVQKKCRLLLQIGKVILQIGEAVQKKGKVLLQIGKVVLGK